MITMTFIITFILLSLLNVILSTIRSIITVKGDKFSASLMSGIYFGFYNIMIIYTVADFPMWQKIVITAITNIIGVFIVKCVEEKKQKEKLWKIECTFSKENAISVMTTLRGLDIPHNYIEIGSKTIVNSYCSTCEQSNLVKNLVKVYDGKYFASETKIL